MREKDAGGKCEAKGVVSAQAKARIRKEHMLSMLMRDKLLEVRDLSHSKQARSDGQSPQRAAVLLFKPTCRLSHPGNYLFLLSKKILSGSKYPEYILFYFENRSTDQQCLCVQKYTEYFGYTLILQILVHITIYNFSKIHNF